MSSGIGFQSNSINIQDKTVSIFAKINRDIDNIAEAIQRIINTVPGERPGQPTFGCNVKRLLFEPNDVYLQRSAEFFIRKAIQNFEPRVTIKKITVTPDLANNSLQIFIWFAQKGTTDITAFKTGTTVTL